MEFSHVNVCPPAATHRITFVESGPGELDERLPVFLRGFFRLFVLRKTYD